MTCWIRIRIQNTDPDSGGDLNTDPPGSWSGSETLYLPPVFRIRIQIARLDPDPYLESGSVFGIRIRILKVKLSYKNPLFPQIFHDFHLFLKLIPNKSSLFNKIPTWLVENKNKIPTFWVENKNFSKNFVFALEILFPGFGIRIRIGEKILDPDP